MDIFDSQLNSVYCVGSSCSKSSPAAVLPTSKSKHCLATVELGNAGRGSTPITTGSREGCFNNMSTLYMAWVPVQLESARVKSSVCVCVGGGEGRGGNGALVFSILQ